MWKLNYHVIIYHHQLTGNLVLDFVSFVSITCNLFFVSLRRNWLSQKFDNANCSYRQPFKETNFLLRKNYNSKTLYCLTICLFNQLQLICKVSRKFTIQFFTGAISKQRTFTLGIYRNLSFSALRSSLKKYYGSFFSQIVWLVIYIFMFYNTFLFRYNVFN